MGLIERFLPDEPATGLLGDDVAAALKPGDLLALHGDLGAGKTTLARAVIRALAGNPALEVPSPTFTLMQAYEARFPVAHFDLYRLASPDELDELGFDEAANGVVLVEWPENAGDRLPEGAIHIRLSEAGGGRSAAISGGDDALSRLERSFATRAFLDKAGWGAAWRDHLLGDASTRAYETVTLAKAAPRILMNAPKQPDGPPIRDGKSYSQIAKLAESVTPFVAVGKALKGAGFAAPDIYFADLDRGLLLLEHLGSRGFLDNEGGPVAERYRAAAELLADVHTLQWPPVLPVAGGAFHRVPAYDDEAMAIETELLIDWYLPFTRGTPADAAERKAFAVAWGAAFTRLRTAEKSLVLRDYHSPNLIWRPERQGRDRLGLVDFQDALIGPSAYDVASLAMDARVMIPEGLETETVEAYCTGRIRAGSFDRRAFDEAYAIMAAQRNTKILGIFVRLNQRDGKPQYLRHLPRIRNYVERALRHPTLAPVREAYRRLGIMEGVET